jgi:hypothetical protein
MEKEILRNLERRQTLASSSGQRAKIDVHDEAVSMWSSFAPALSGRSDSAYEELSMSASPVKG